MIDLRSDTVTKPTQEMREAMYHAEVGDDVYGEDPTVTKLETLAAEMLGKESALFVTSGTQGNQIAVLTHGKPGDEIILEADSHIFYYEAGAVAALAGVQTRTIQGERGRMPLDKIREAIREEGDIHLPQTAMIGLENTHNRAGGVVIPPDYMKAVYQLAQEKGIPVHLDGARLFNAAIALDVGVKEFTKYVDTVQVCLSKGLSAPMGSILAGPKEWIERARKWRKRLGGGMRQSGLMAAPGIVALTKMVDRLAEDHHRAKDLAKGINEIEGIQIDLEHVETNIVLINIKQLGITAVQFLNELKEFGILGSAFGEYLIRLTTHREIQDEDITQTVNIFTKVVQQLRKRG
ncbi:low-specificity L-threonine aldolase [Tepidibacillus infernus]|uniref:Threonine aldolase n=1 Tax=Tepidibacillus decaturensis TaxID=1413211 RepID=A0A135L2Q0_9BACI|nr:MULTISPECIES: low-specificity L-threonine aldolase [Tepidibacillus]KXG43123.1 threonine aldolase [Tepidibacillus decaturensis]GBF10070.1 L-allo-threonine aldolase [Tepidibacillus sp. HK-1]